MTLAEFWFGLIAFLFSGYFVWRDSISGSECCWGSSDATTPADGC